MINDAEITAIVGVHGIRNKQLQNIRRNIRNSATIRVVRRKLLFKALDAIEQPELHKLKDISLGQVALMTAKMSPNEIYEVVKATEQDSAARGGEIAPEDIVIEAMGTQFPPGPMISEFQKVGLQTAIEKGKIANKERNRIC
ncbi:MAG: 50S ribosomal protein L10 [Candidatus Thermoplasmatota archaeon]|nr:50S ribosomal protein L10 [Candidatus Thermoplasmatota archaeon]